MYGFQLSGDLKNQACRQNVSYWLYKHIHNNAFEYCFKIRFLFSSIKLPAIVKLPLYLQKIFYYFY